jgi:hypothetical protein
MDKKSIILRLRLKETRNWIENFLEVERHRSISKKAIKQLNKENPMLWFIFTGLYLPSKIVKFISDIYWKNEYNKAEKEVEIIKKQMGEINEQHKL